ncbi:hypothetical protein PUNSTDRAFT_55335 [Punctularia strigosozonata HHB-11173 SS5]|uniref:Acyltransferase MbtK/IucB-like conserved domain-containing protein n=1 Tax=Punctularia strigosozonata (strain HHB-11173) TaxID=741275 RepID=R7S2H3_PUNST|nr:uncharacterized protein PUNSTDRAFT_55335 [Punctularia strigosozonata HHB-11173 SS5]EIN04595.1 hypothetical protein PUNSTDRAFT_55335 [Punctularia strigosozonata HHB-11173 SS5]
MEVILPFEELFVCAGDPGSPEVLTISNDDPNAVDVVCRLHPTRNSDKLPDPSDNTLAARIARAGDTYIWETTASALDLPSIASAVFALFSLHRSQEFIPIILNAASHPKIRDSILKLGLGIPTPGREDGVTLVRSSIWQIPVLGFLPGPSGSDFPLFHVVSNGRRHPLRPPKPEDGSIIYKRYIPHLSKWFELRVVDPKSEKDIALFHEWHNNPRVAAAWGESGPIEHHKTYLNNAEADPHQIPAYGMLDGIPFMYSELYWAYEDNIGPFVGPGQASEWDRGMHILVGDEKYRGPHIVQAWVSSLLHYLFLADSRTQRIVMEPRATNTKVIDYLCKFGGFCVTKHFDFPHKRSALLELTRERFFQLAPFYYDA